MTKESSQGDQVIGKVVRAFEDCAKNNPHSLKHEAEPISKS